MCLTINVFVFLKLKLGLNKQILVNIVKIQILYIIILNVLNVLKIPKLTSAIINVYAIIPKVKVS